MNNPFVLCSVFLDPRLKSMLLKCRDQSLIAKMYLSQLWERIHQFEKKQPVETTHDDENEIPSEFNFELLEKFMHDIVHNVDEIVPESVQMKSQLEAFALEKCEPMSKNIFEYWEEKKDTFPELYKLAKVVHAVPAAQASCERTFSTATFVFSRYRSKLSQQMLQDILLIRLNRVFFYEVVSDEIANEKFKNNDE